MPDAAADVGAEATCTLAPVSGRVRARRCPGVPRPRRGGSAPRARRRARSRAGPGRGPPSGPAVSRGGLLRARRPVRPWPGRPLRPPGAECRADPPPGRALPPSRTVIAVRAATSRCASLRDGDPDEATLRGLADGPADGLVTGSSGCPWRSIPGGGSRRAGAVGGSGRLLKERFEGLDGRAQRRTESASPARRPRRPPDAHRAHPPRRAHRGPPGPTAENGPVRAQEVTEVGRSRARAGGRNAAPAGRSGSSVEEPARPDPAGCAKARRSQSWRHGARRASDAGQGWLRARLQPMFDVTPPTTPLSCADMPAPRRVRRRTTAAAVIPAAHHRCSSPAGRHSCAGRQPARDRAQPDMRTPRNASTSHRQARGQLQWRRPLREPRKVPISLADRSLAWISTFTSRANRSMSGPTFIRSIRSIR